MWLRHWNLVRDPFPARGGPYVATPPHDEAVACLVRAIGSGEPVTLLRAGAGLGKSTVLARALDSTRSPSLRVAIAVAPADPLDLLTQLLRSLRVRLGSVPTIASAWRHLNDSARLIGAQRSALLMAIDGVGGLSRPEDRRHLDRLAHLGNLSGPAPRLILLDRPDQDDDADIDNLASWTIPLPPLTRTEADAYLTTKLRLSGRDAPTFAPRSLALLHNLASGVPTALDRLAGLSLRAAALASIGLIGPDLIASLDERGEGFRLGSETSLALTWPRC